MAKTRTVTQPAQAFASPRLVVDNAPLDKPWSMADIRRLCFPTIKALPFVLNKKDAQPGWLPESYWHTEPTGRFEEDYELGKEYALRAVAAMQVDGANVLSSIFRDMIKDGVERAQGKRGRRRHNPVTAGFLHQLAKMLPVVGGIPYGPSAN
jgi:hypothetical protein